MKYFMQFLTLVLLVSIPASLADFIPGGPGAPSEFPNGLNTSGNLNSSGTGQIDGNTGIGQAPGTSKLMVLDNGDDNTAVIIKAAKDGGYVGTVLDVVATRGPNAAFNVITAKNNSSIIIFNVQGDGDTVLTVQDDGVSSCPDGGTVCSGTTPISSTTALGCIGFGTADKRGVWSRVGNIVTVAGKISMNCVTTNGTWNMSPPIPSNFTLEGDCAGYAAATNVERSFMISTDTGNDACLFNPHGVNSGASFTSAEFYFHYTYIIRP